nr:MAG TPA: hypothetical protein [Caudoviricetes sp.]
MKVLVIIPPIRLIDHLFIIDRYNLLMEEPPPHIFVT